VKVFLSWSGALSRSLAVELRDWLRMAVHHAEPWISSQDIGPGERWALALGQELGAADFAILAITVESQSSPWLLFEAGALARSVEARVVPVLLGVSPSELDGPLAQFQAVKANQEGIEQLVAALFSASASTLDAKEQDVVFERLWPILEGRLSELAARAARNEAVESVETVVRDVESSTASTGQSAEVPAQDLFQRLDRLEGEYARLQKELAYLKDEEKKLTDADAPISLQDRAIVPTEQRLGRVGLSLRQVLDQAVADLDPAERAFLRELAAQSGVRLARQLRNDEQQILEHLVNRGLVHVDEAGATLVHDLVAEYVSRLQPGVQGDQSLSEAARELLLAASADSGGTVLKVGTLGGVCVQTNGREFVEKSDPRSAARWRSAVDELQYEGLLEDRVGKGEVFFVTEHGYRMADGIRRP